MPSPRWLLKSVLALGSVGIALGVVEVTLRQFFPVRGMIYQLDDHYLYTHIPGSRKLTNPAGEDWPKVLVRINAAGRRGDESTLPGAAHRVVVYGDSFVSAEYTKDADTYVSQLERALNQRAAGTSVLNAGVTGYGVDQECLRIEDELAALKPDLVVVAIFAGNDYGDLLRDKLFRLDDAGQLTRNTPVIDEAVTRAFRVPFELSSIQIVRALQSEYQKWQERRRRDAAPAAAAAPVDRAALRLEHRRAEYENYVVNGDNNVREFFDDDYDADVSFEPDSASARYRVRLMGLVLERIHRAVQQSGAGLLFLIIPDKCDAGNTCKESDQRRRYPGYRPSGLTDTLESIVRAEGVAHVNLFDAFRGGDATLYHPIDGHWNAAGQLLAARLTADAITSAGLLRH